MREAPDFEWIDDLLRQACPRQEPSEADLQRAETVYLGLIGHRERRRRHLMLGRPAGTLALVLVLALGLGQVSAPAATASLVEIADRVRTTEPVDAPSQEYIYTRTESLTSGIRNDSDGPLVFQATVVNEIWRGIDPKILQIRTTISEPHFFNTRDRDRFHQAGLSGLNGMGQTTTRTMEGLNTLVEDRDWPTDPVEMMEALRDVNGAHSDASVFGSAIGLLAEPLIPSEVRAAAIEVLASMGAEVTAEFADSVTFELTIHDSWAPVELSRVTLTKSGHLIQVETIWPSGSDLYGVPAGSAMLRTRYEPTVIVPGLESP